MKNNNCWSRARLFVIPLLFFTTNVGAAVIYDNGVTAFNSYAVSQPNADQLVADDFKFNTAATITGIQWKGTYSMYSTQQDAFTLLIHADNNGMQETNALYTLPVGNNVNRTEWIGNPNPGNQTYIFTYSADISPISLPTGTYWLSIFNDSANIDPFYRWCWIHQFDPIQGNEAIRSAIDQPYAYTTPYRTDFKLIGISSVPIPPAFWLFGSGLIGLLGFVRRDCRTRQ